jgi:chloramphenicol-sensitive protein RarD
MPPDPPSARRAAAAGVAYAVGAFAIWGLSPVYWKALQAVPPLEIIAHRVVWSLLLLAALVGLKRQGGELRAALKAPRVRFALAGSTVLLAGNWLLYVWAVNSGHLLQGSLGYYINPLINVALGRLFLGERLRRAQAAAVVLALAAVGWLTAAGGEPPWIALALALSFGGYGLIRKTAPVGALVGLAVETLLLAPAAAAFLLYRHLDGTGAFLRVSPALDGLLPAVALLTVFPLLFFTQGARRLTLATLGLLQYIAPSGMFLLAVAAYDEPFPAARLWTFLAIWTALALYSADSIRAFRRAGRAQVGQR